MLCPLPQRLRLQLPPHPLGPVRRNAARFRKEAGLTQEQLAERCGLSQQYLSGLEKGKRNPTVVTLYEIAQGLGVSHVELVRPD
jgi:transcriptional regulator with XRE-family HTH domain